MWKQVVEGRVLQEYIKILKVTILIEGLGLDTADNQGIETRLYTQ
jgi:hypothetical protein